MRYEITIQGKTYTVSEAAALKASSGRPIPPEGLTINGQSQNITDPDHVSETVAVFIKPIV